MKKRSDLVREVKSALTRGPQKSPSGRYAVYVPGAVVLGTYGRKADARDVAATWTEMVPEVVIVDLGAGAGGFNRNECQPLHSEGGRRTARTGGAISDGGGEP